MKSYLSSKKWFHLILTFVCLLDMTTTVLLADIKLKCNEIETKMFRKTLSLKAYPSLNQTLIAILIYIFVMKI